MRTCNAVVAGTLIVLAAQAAMVVAKMMGWEPVAKHTWLTIAWFPWVFAGCSLALAVMLLLAGVAFDRGLRKLEVWLERRAHAGR